MLSISGIVPNGVPAVFLTAPDGTAVRADVKDNGHEFLLPNQRAYEQRYVVWTGGDGTPHVQPIVTFAAARAGACKSSAKLAQSVARVSPDGAFGCTGAPIANKFAVPVPRGPSRALRLRRQVAEMLLVTRCAGAACWRRASLSPAARSQRLCRGAAGPSGAAGGRGPGPARPGARHARARASPQAPLTTRRPRVASMRWLLPDPSSS